MHKISDIGPFDPARNFGPLGYSEDETIVKPKRTGEIGIEPRRAI
jgi:hypothetical protein